MVGKNLEDQGDRQIAALILRCLGFYDVDRVLHFTI